MYVIHNLQQPLKSFGGQEFLSISKDADGKQQTKPLAFAEAFIGALGGITAEKGFDGNDKVNAYDLALRIKSAETDEIEISEDEYNLVQRCVSANDFVGEVHAQLIKAIKAEKVAE